MFEHKYVQHNKTITNNIWKKIKRIWSRIIVKYSKAIDGYKFVCGPDQYASTEAAFRLPYLAYRV